MTPTPPSEASKLLPTQPSAENAGAGGWTPKQGTPLWAAITIGVIGSSSAPLMVALPSPWNMVVGGVLAGLAASLAAYFGMRSAGPRQP